MMKKQTISMVALLALAASLAVAETPDENQSDTEPVESGEVEYVFVRQPYTPTANTIATKLPVPVQLIPANVGTVGDLLLREQAAVVLGDALENVSGLNVQPGSGVFDYFVLRGFDSLNGGLVLTDGAGEPEVTFYPMYNVEGVEVLKGPGGFLYGSNPLAGAVNIVRKQPVPSDLVDLQLRGGSFGAAEGRLDWNLAGDDGRALRLNAFWSESEHYRDDMDSTHFGINPSFVFTAGENTRLNLSLEYVEAEFQPDSGLPLVFGFDPSFQLVVQDDIPDVPRRRSYQSPLDFSDQQLARIQLDVEHRLGERLRLRNKTYYRQLDWKTDGTLLLGAFPDPMTGGLQVSRVLNMLDDDQALVGNQFEVVIEADTGGITHQLLAGVELAGYDDEFRLDFAQLPALDLFDPVETATRGALFSIPLSAGDVRSTVIAPYVVDQIRFNDRFQLLAGVRYDNIDFEGDYVLTDPLTGLPFSESVDRDDSEVSPMLGLLLAPNADLSLYANASRSYAPASARVVGEREPEQSTQVELGVKKRFGDRLRGTLAVYELERDNIAIPDDNGITQQAGDQRSRGVELEIVAEASRGTRALFAYAYNDAELTRFSERLSFPLPQTVDRSGNTPAFAPRHLGRLWLSHRLPSGFGVAAGARYIGEQYIAEDNAFRIDDVIVFDAALFCDFDSWRLALNLDNLTDEDYETRGFGSSSVIPADPLAAYLTVEYRFR